MSNIQLLKSKLTIPSLRTDLVPRPRLAQALDLGLRQKLTLVSAPAGFGKTTLLAVWARDCGRPVAWLALDDLDNDPVRFLTYFVASLQPLDAGTTQSLLDELSTGHLLGPDAAFAYTGLLAELVNRLSAIPADFALVLDDYHLITAQPVHEIITFLLNHLPGQMHLVLASRADPPLPLARLRGCGQLHELRLAELRFTSEETARFMAQTMSLDLRSEDLAALTQKTEGWVAGLQMVAISMQGRDDLSSFIRSFTGSNRFILDYLVEEVLQRQPDFIQDFLLHTAILNRLSGPLCDGILERPLLQDGILERLLLQDQGKSQAILESLEHANLFILPLDDRREWYRYHHLFQDLLCKCLGQTYPDRVASLHCRASEWFEQNDYLEDAIEHAFSANDIPRAARLVESIAEATMKRSEMATLKRWLELLPDEQFAARPGLSVYHAWILLLDSQPMARIEARLSVAVSVAAAANDEQIIGQSLVLRALIASFQGQPSLAITLVQQALEKLKNKGLFTGGLALLILASSEMSEGNLEAGYQAFQQVARIGEQSGNLTASVTGLVVLAENYRKEGQLRMCERLCLQALDLAVDANGKRLPIAGRPLIALGDLMRERNQLELADRYLDEGIALVQRWGVMAAYSGLTCLARLRQAQGNLAGAMNVLDQASRIADRTDMTSLDDRIVAMMRAALWALQENFPPAERWAGQCITFWKLDVTGLSESDRYIFFHMQKYEQIVLVRLRLAQERHEEALSLLEDLLPKVEKARRVGILIEVHCLRALAFHNLKNNDLMIQALESALNLAMPERYMRLFLDEGQPMRHILEIERARLRDGHPLKAYAEELLAAFPGGEDIPPILAPRTVASQPGERAHRVERLLEPLSERELEVLRLLRTSLTVPEIAERLYIAESTLRSHVKSIYSKLNVHRRIDALYRAEELSLL